MWVPAIALGRMPDPPESRGYHQLATEAFTMEVGEPFILDGEAFPPGRYRVSLGPQLRFVAP
jgi:diacylglycerol kinase (ATP)